MMSRGLEMNAEFHMASCEPSGPAQLLVGSLDLVRCSRKKD